MQSVFFDNIFDWMGFNLFLAFVPLVISFIVFNKGLWEGNLIVKPFNSFSKANQGVPVF